MRTAFLLTQTKASRSNHKLTSGLKPLLRKAAISVARAELPNLTHLSLSVVLMSDAELLELNISALGHDWFTDIITFELERDATSIEAEIYLSVDRAGENAVKAKVSLENELIHLVIHGMLHLARYDDHDRTQKKRMKQQERFYLAQF